MKRNVREIGLAWAAERLFERAGVYLHAPSDSYRGDLAALYHLVDEGLGDPKALCDFGHAEELAHASPPSVPEPSAFPIAAVLLIWSTRFSLSCVSSIRVYRVCPSECVVSKMLSAIAHPVVHTCWHRSASLAMQCRLLDGDGVASISGFDATQRGVRA